MSALGSTLLTLAAYAYPSSSDPMHASPVSDQELFKQVLEELLISTSDV